VGLEDLPWQHPPDSYALAVTGKAFNHLLNDTDPSSQVVLKQVLIKAQIYARMQPDDKVKLVEKL
jgi:magnesium-transporting ATPase (P-type)